MLIPTSTSSRNRLGRRLGALAVVGLLAAAVPASGQTLAERIEHVRAKRAQEAEQAAARRSAASRQTQMLQRLFYTPITVNFQGAPARDAIEYIRTITDINLVARYRDDATGVGIDPQATIDLTLDEVDALVVLELVLEQCADLEDATWQIRNGFIEVGTKDRLSTAQARYTRVYPVDDLLYETPRFDDAPDIQLDNLYRDYPYGYAPYLYGGPYGSAAPSFGGGTSISGSIGGPSTSVGPGPGNLPYERDARGEELADNVTMIVETDAWERNGGSWASLRYTQGTLIVNAPEFIHRQIAGGPKIPRPPRP